ncbi:MAG: outer membrane beta-barrel protein [Paludibacteraceae bacterium]|nr:outer membrane beta-barrel protein [Paludibacteraceae bacterium]
MQKSYKNRVFLSVVLMLLMSLSVRAEQLPYLCDFGVQGGIGYYIGDAQPHPFMMPREVYGAQFRYKFNSRWAIQVKGQYQKVAFKYAADNIPGTMQVGYNNMINLDAVGEFNFFRYGEKTSDTRIKPITPYIFLGIGAAIYGEDDDRYGTLGIYFPFGIGMKWRFAPRWQLLVAWQHNLYFVDDVENVQSLGNTYNMNGSNFINDDLLGQLTVGIAFEFAQMKAVCKTCSWK